MINVILRFCKIDFSQFKVCHTWRLVMRYMRAATAAAVILAVFAGSAHAGIDDPVLPDDLADYDPLAGDEKLACEALLCLASNDRPHECEPSIRKLFSIWKPHKRVRFLRLCPKTQDDQQMDNFAVVTARAWPTCTARYLNANHVYRIGDGDVYVRDDLPQACANYNAHEWTAHIQMPRYVGQPQNGGHWVDQD